MRHLVRHDVRHLALQRDRRMLVVDEQKGCDERNNAGILHRASREIWQSDQVQFFEGILDAKILVVVMHEEFRGLECETVELLLARGSPDANWNAVCLALHRLKFTHCNRYQI